MYNSPIICCIDGNIGAGKSTILEELEKRGYCVFKEDISSWEWFLDNYYTNPNRWAFTLQIAILNSMNDQKRRMMKSEKPFVFIERSPLSGAAFTRVAYKRGFMNPEEFALMNTYFERIGWRPDITLMLDTPLDVCFERIRSRNRSCESNVNYSYISSVAEEYNKIVDTVQLDCRGDPQDIADRVLKLVWDIK